MTVIIGGGSIGEAIRDRTRSIVIYQKDFELIRNDLVIINANTPITEIFVTAGYLEKSEVGEYSTQNIEKTINANFTIPILIANLSVKLFPTAKLVIFSSSVVFEPREGYGAYSAAKTGLEIFIRTLKKENPEYIVKLIRNSRTDTKLRWDNYQRNESTEQNLLTPDEVAKATLNFLNIEGTVMEIFKREEKLYTEVWNEG